MKRLLTLLKRLLVTAVVLAVIGAVAFYFSQDLVVFPGRGLYTGNTPEWQSRMAALATQGFSPIEIQGAGGVMVRGVKAPSTQEPAPYLLWIHARDRNITEINQHLKPLSGMGVNVFAMEYRGYGNSAGDTTEDNLLADMGTAYDFLSKCDDLGSRKVLVGGVELGATLALKFASTRTVTGVIAVSPLPDIATAVRQKIPFAPLGFLVRQKFELMPSLAGITAPVFIAQGTEDAIVPMGRIEEIVARLATRARLYEVQGAGHDDVIERGGRDLMEQLDLFVTRGVK